VIYYISVQRDTMTGGYLSRYRKNDYPQLTQQEMDRKRRYREFEDMDNYPEIGSAFDIYADDCSQQNLNGSEWEIISDEDLVKQEISELFETITLDRYLWDIIRNTVKYGDCFIEIVPDLNDIKKGIQRIKILDPNYIIRVENEYGHLTDFLQEIPLREDWDVYGSVSEVMKNRQVIPLDKNQIVHFKLHTSDPLYYPYGKGIAAVARQIYRSLKIMEDAMLIYRLSRAPERRIFYIDTGQLPSSKAAHYIEMQKAKFKKEKFFDQGTGQIDSRYNPLSADEDFFVAVNGQRSGTKIDVLPGAQNLGEVDDVKYFRDKLLAALKIPKDYIVEKDQSPERKANLAQLDVKFARTVGRIQKSIEIGLETIAKRHLAIKGFPFSLISRLKIKLPEPSDMAVKRQLDIDEQKARVVAAVKGLGIFPMEKIYKDYYKLTDAEIEKIREDLEDQSEDPTMSVLDPNKMLRDQDKMMQQQQAMGGMPMDPNAMGGAMPMDPNAMGAAPPPMAGPGPMEAGGQEPAENVPPTALESKNYNNLAQLMVEGGCSEEAIKIINDLIKTKKSKND